MELSAGHQLMADVGVHCYVFCCTCPWRCLLILAALQSMNITDGPRNWLGRLAVVNPLVTVNVNRCSNMKY